MNWVPGADATGVRVDKRAEGWIFTEDRQEERTDFAVECSCSGVQLGNACESNSDFAAFFVLSMFFRATHHHG
jgi:hypothetical protein